MPRIDDTTDFICLSNKPFESRKYTYKGAKVFKPKSGMWFSFPSKQNGRVSEWHGFLCDRAPEIISLFCNEEGKTNVISAKLNDTIIVTASEVMDVYKEAQKQINYSSSTDEKRKKFLETVKSKFNISDGKHMVLEIDKEGFEPVFELFFSGVLENDSSDVDRTSILQKVRDRGVFYNYSPLYTSETGKNQLHEYKKFIKLITECLCDSDNLEESEITMPFLLQLASVLSESMFIMKRPDPFSKFPMSFRSFPYIKFKKYSSREKIEEILNHVDAPQTKKDSLLSEYDGQLSTMALMHIFESETFLSLMKDELFKDYAEFIDKVRKNNIILHDIRGFVEEECIPKVRSKISGTKLFEMFVESKEKSEKSFMEDAHRKIPQEIFSFFSGMINPSYIEDGLELPSLVIFDTDCLTDIRQKELALFNKEQMISGIERNASILSDKQKSQDGLVEGMTFSR